MSEERAPISVALVNDERRSLMGDTTWNDEAERGMMLETLAYFGVAPVRVVYSGRDPVEATKAEPELIVTDFGGLSQGYGTERLRTYVDWLAEWARERPNALVYLASDHTWLGWKYALAGTERAELPNVVHQGDNRGPDDGTGYEPLLYGEDEDEHVYGRIRGWFGIKGTPRELPVVNLPVARCTTGSVLEDED